MIQITVNGERVEIESPMTVEQLLDTVDVPPNYLAVEVNADVVPREEYHDARGRCRRRCRGRDAGRRRLSFRIVGPSRNLSLPNRFMRGRVQYSDRSRLSKH